MSLSAVAHPLTANASHIVHVPPTSPLHAFDVAGPTGAPIILAPRFPALPVGHPPPQQPPPATLPPPHTMPPQPSLVSFGDLPPAPLFVHFDPFLAAAHQTAPAAIHHTGPAAVAAVDNPAMSTIAYVR